MRRLLLLLSLLLQPLDGVAQTLTKEGPEFRVNTYTTGFQSSPKVAVGTRDQFIVTWGSEGSYGSDLGASIQAQQFYADGTRRGSEFQVNSYTTSFQLWPAVAFNDINDFVIVWASIGSYGSDSDVFSIQGQRFSARAVPLGGQFQVSTYTTDWQLLPEVASNDFGEFIVTWDSGGSAGTDTDSYSVQAQRLDREAQLVGPEFQVNTYTTRRQYYPSIAADPVGNFIVVWESLGSFGNDQFAASVQGQRFAADGSRIGGEFQVNAYTTGAQRAPAVAVSDAGEFMVVWASNAERNNQFQGYVVQGQSFSANGTRIGAEFQVNHHTTVSNRWPVVAADPSGNFVVAWGQYDYNAETPRGDIYLRRVSRTGAMMSEQFQASSVQNGHKSFPSVGAQAGGFVVVWRAEYPSGPLDVEIKGQRVSLATGGFDLFADGFESGNVSAWSSAVP